MIPIIIGLPADRPADKGKQDLASMPSMPCSVCYMHSMQLDSQSPNPIWNQSVKVWEAGAQGAWVGGRC